MTIVSNNSSGRPSDELPVNILIITKSSILVIIIDQMLRWTILALYKNSLITTTVFWLSQLLFIWILASVFVIAVISKRNKKKIREKIKDGVLKSNFTFNSKASGNYYTWALLFSIIGGFVTYSLFSTNIESDFLRALISIGGGLLYFFLTMFYLGMINDSAQSSDIVKVFEVLPDKSENELKLESIIKQVILITNTVEIQQIEEGDKNDVAIVKLKGDVKNMGTMADSYLLESVLLGGLAFSGFLTITSEKGLSSDFFTNFFTILTSTWEELFNFNLTALVDKVGSLTIGENLFALISIETLLCSIFFILVIAIRLQFTKHLEKIDYLARLANTFNSKEEEVSNILINSDSDSLKIKLEHRLKYLSNRIDLSLTDAENLLKQTSPIMTYMVIFRNIGVVLFYLILITCGMLFSYGFSLFIFTLAIFALFYSRIQSFFDNRKFRNILSRHSAKESA
jgi:hypothetical protein